MVILRKDTETKEIEIPGFRKILKNTKHPDYKELRIYIKKGWIPVDTEDDKRQIEKAKKRKKTAKENKARRPKYIEMEKAIKKLDNNQQLLDEFNKKKAVKNNYKNVLDWYNKNVVILINKANEDETTPPEETAKGTKGAKGEAK